MTQDFIEARFKENQACKACPSPEKIHVFLESLLAFLFPEYHKKDFSSLMEFQSYVEQLELNLKQLLTRNAHLVAKPEEACTRFFKSISILHEMLHEDIEAMLLGDPAAKSKAEIIKSYPGFYAIAAYRIAHSLKTSGVQMIPRIITEIAHSKTGIDIHPGAQIGRHFCIDHGTGIVIGETTIVGDHVKIYQGVTLGGLSVDKAQAERKRHPTIGDGVVIYAGATILGGTTLIGANSVIGGNVWLTRSVPPNTKVYYKAALSNEQGLTDMIEYK